MPSYSKMLEESKENPQPTFLCPTCGRLFYKKFMFDRHEKKHISEKYKLNCVTAAVEFMQDKVDGVMRNTSQKRRGKKGSKIDTEANSDEKKFKCQVCGKGFTHRSNKAMHEKIHSDEKLFACSVCGKCFSQRRVLVRHEKIHQGTDRVECDICGRTFSQRSSYNRHKRIHAVEEKFICRICGKGFKQLRYLIEHEDRHVASMDEKVFSCQYCGRGFQRRSGYMKHMKVHKKRSIGAGTVARHEETGNKELSRTENDDDIILESDGAGINKSSKLLTVTMTNCVVMGDDIVISAIDEGAVALIDEVTMDIDAVQTMGLGGGAVAVRDEGVTMVNEPVTMGGEITDTENLSLLVSSEVEVVTMLDDFTVIM